MAFGFPISLISKLRCSSDGYAFEMCETCQLSIEGTSIINGAVRCSHCKKTIAVNEGILDFLNSKSLDAESKHEQQLRNEIAKRSIGKCGIPDSWTDNHNLMEILPTLEAISACRNSEVLELGCGSGRYTHLLAEKCHSILAVDFSLESLILLKSRLGYNGNIGLVLADITNMKVALNGFDIVISTLVSNLPTRGHRNAMYTLAAKALKNNGHFVYSVHNHGWRQLLDGRKKSGRYNSGGIYRYNFTFKECKAEVKPYFKTVKTKPIQIYFPFAIRMRLPLVALSRFLERFPLSYIMSELILVVAKRPILAE